MLAKRIIPCLDVTGGRVVKGVNFVELRDAGDPVEIAARYNAQGADELTFLDITATSDDRDLILHIIEAVASQVFIPLTVGGGVRTVDDVRRLLNAGADKTSFNSAAIANRFSDREPVLSRVVGKHCEGGDILIRDVFLPADVRIGDLIAVPGSGAYARSMASNYNQIPKPPVVSAKDGVTRVMLRRETLEDLMRLDVGE